MVLCKEKNLIGEKLSDEFCRILKYIYPTLSEEFIESTVNQLKPNII